AGSNDPDADLGALIAERRAEQDAAANVLGVTDVRYLGYPDGALPTTLDVRRDVTRLIREIKPDRVLCQDPTTVFRGDGYINHPDHRAAGEAAIYAVFPSAETRPIFPELVEEGHEPHKVNELWMTLTNHPNTVVDISDSFEDKIEALVKHASQLGDGKRAAERIAEWNAEAGEPYGFQYAETFRVVRFRRPEPTEGEAVGEPEGDEEA
ncbi:MAG: PIG-L deacetylase family protein, partial [Anaerolineae bacterium]